MKLTIQTLAVAFVVIFAGSTSSFAQRQQVKMAGFTTPTAPTIASSAVVRKGVFSTPTPFSSFPRTSRVVVGLFGAKAPAAASYQPGRIVLGLFPRKVD